jgi:hypothetical protein
MPLGTLHRQMINTKMGAKVDKKRPIEVQNVNNLETWNVHREM